MYVFHVFKIIQMVPNPKTHYIYIYKSICNKFVVLLAIHSVKNVRIRSFFRSVFPLCWTEFGVYTVNIRIQAKYGKMRPRKISVFGHFTSSDYSPFAFKIMRNTEQNNIAFESVLNSVLSFLWVQFVQTQS